MRFVIFRENFEDDKWRWAIREGRNALVTSRETYPTEDAVIDAVRLLRRGRIVNIDAKREL